jgi:serine/threonine-protein kinase
MEYVDGSQLSSLIPSGGLPIDVVLRYGMQIADGLEHAHERGVVHGDLKTSNVMVTPEGRVKILDFGLARRAFTEANEDTTLAEESGPQDRAVAGTLSYMAPETLRADPRQPPSDIWALGVLLYEISCGDLPFSGRTAFDLTAAILRGPVSPLPARVPPALRAVIHRCLAKEPSQRYHRAGEVRAALEAIDSSLGPTGVEAPTELHVRPAPRRWIVALGGAVVVALGLTGLWWLRVPSLAPPAALGGRSIPIVVSEGHAFDPTISPDGRMVAFVAEANGSVDLFVADARGDGRVRLTDDAAREEDPQFSPDGTRLIFTRARPGSELREVCVIPVLRGQIVTIAERAAYPAWSADGTRVAYVRFPSPPDSGALVVANADGSGARPLLTADGAYPFILSPAWSPDSSEIVVVRSAGGAATQLWLVPVAGGSPRRLSNDPTTVFNEEPVFMPDGRGIIHASNRSGAVNLWLMPRTGGTPLRLTTGAGPDTSPSVARDGSVVFANTRWRYVLEAYDVATQKLRTLVTHASYIWGPTFSPDGRDVAYSQTESDGSWRIWIVPASGGAPRRLSSTPGGEIYPRYTPDGSAMLYHNWNEPRRVWRLPTSGGPPVQLAWSQGPDDSYAEISPDGLKVLFVRTDGQTARLHIAPLTGGESRQLLDTDATVPRWSPDGEWIAFSPSRGYTGGIMLVRADGGGLRRLTDRGGWPVWWPDGQRIAYLAWGEDGTQVVETVPIAGGPPTRVTGLRYSASNHPIAISPDGATIATSNSIHVSDEIWLFTEAR